MSIRQMLQSSSNISTKDSKKHGVKGVVWDAWKAEV